MEYFRNDRWMEKNKNKHSHLTFDFENYEIYYEDMRNFGTFKFNKSKVEFTKDKIFSTDIFEDDFTIDYVKKLFSNKLLVKKLW